MKSDGAPSTLMRALRVLLPPLLGLAATVAAGAGVYAAVSGNDPPNGAVAVDCDAVAPGIQDDCAYPIGATFDVQVHVVVAPTGGYYGHQMKLAWDDPRLDYLPAPSPGSENLWPNCGIPVRSNNQPGEPSMLFGCIPMPPLLTGKTATGAILQLEFTCQQAGSTALQLVPRLGDPQQGTYFLDGAGTEIDPVLTNASVECLAAPTPTPTPTASPTPTPDVDSDADGCLNGQELSPDPALGGARDPFLFWDLFDTPDPISPRDRIISTGDIVRVLGRFGTNGDAGIDPLSEPPASGYHTAFDRAPPDPGGDPWDLAAPDGVIATNDVLFVVIQFGHSCAGAR